MKTLIYNWGGWHVYIQNLRIYAGLKAVGKVDVVPHKYARMYNSFHIRDRPLSKDNLSQVYEMMKDCNNLLIEWAASDLTKQILNLPKVCRIVLRPHVGVSFRRDLNWKNVDSVIVSCESERRSVPMNKGVIVQQGVDTNILKPDPERDYSSKVIGFVGRPLKKKGYHDVIKMSKLMTDYKFICKIAQAVPFNKMYWKSIIRTDKIKTINEFYYLDKMCELYNKFPFLMGLNHSTMGGQFMAGIEAMSCGTIPILYPWHEAKDYYSKNLIVDNNINSVINKVRSLHKDSSKLEEVGKYLRRYVLKRYSEEKLLPKAINVICGKEMKLNVKNIESRKESYDDYKKWIDGD